MPEDLQNRQYPKFSHPIEQAFSKILDFYGIEWQYEPHSFPLETDANGNVLEAFTPDFFLPQQNLYIELTTLRPKLNRYKNRRIKKIKQLYPEINIKLLKRRDLHNLMIKFGLETEAKALEGRGAQNRNIEAINDG